MGIDAPGLHNRPHSGVDGEQNPQDLPAELHDLPEELIVTRPRAELAAMAAQIQAEQASSADAARDVIAGVADVEAQKSPEKDPAAQKLRSDVEQIAGYADQYIRDAIKLRPEEERYFDYVRSQLTGLAGVAEQTLSYHQRDVADELRHWVNYIESLQRAHDRQENSVADQVNRASGDLGLTVEKLDPRRPVDAKAAHDTADQLISVVRDVHGQVERAGSARMQWRSEAVIAISKAIAEVQGIYQNFKRRYENGERGLDVQTVEEIVGALHRLEANAHQEREALNRDEDSRLEVLGHRQRDIEEMLQRAITEAGAK